MAYFGPYQERGGWVKEQHDIPGPRITRVGNTCAQFIPRYNIQVAALLVQDMHTRNDYWKPWSSSQWCWEDTDKWIAKWKKWKRTGSN